MCGIAGIVSRNGLDEAELRAMTDPIRHRGPDDQGVWIDADAGIGLGHRRLSIVDLSPSGHQPMTSSDGRWVICYNGEIYNHGELRAALDAGGCTPVGGWRGHSDTETLVEAVAAWGLDETISRSAGMFALALWDRRERTLHLLRDRFGEKPLYYGVVGGDLVFGSELKALRGHPGFDNPISRRALRLYTARTYVPAPLTIFQRVYKLPPGHHLTIRPDAGFPILAQAPAEGKADAGLLLTGYWRYADVVRAGLRDPIADEVDALDALEGSLADAIRGQAVADVPVGAFLSGGIDSSTIVGLYRKHTTGTVRTYSIGFDDAAFNEAEHAKAVARHFGTDHSELYVSAADAREVIPLLPSIYDEPFADSSQIPTYLVSRFARQQVTVALSGDGGDELFGGYNRHVDLPRLWGRVGRLPRPLRTAAGATLGQLPASVWTSLASVAPGGRRRPSVGQKIRKGLGIAGAANGVDDVYALFLDEWSGGSPVIDDPTTLHDLAPDMDVGDDADDVVRMMYADATSYLPDDILCKVDRAGMAVSLESRIPFLDHRVAAVAARIPVALKIQGGRGKHILRELLYREAPRALFERPKAGFAIPLGEWLRRELRPWAEELLDPRRLRDEGFFDATRVRSRWQRHLAGSEDAAPALWAVLMFQAWREHWG